jgi:hypothetical protein
MKQCGKCLHIKEDVSFGKNINNKDGLQSWCKSCRAEYQKDNKEKLTEYYKNWYSENRDVRVLEMQDYYQNNKKMFSDWSNVYRETNKSIISKRKKKYRENNLDKLYSSNAKRRAAKLQALPKWLTPEQLEQIKELYTCAQMFKLYTGEEYHVDHIVPLQGENVCGLHVPWNLQVIPAKENLSKSNKLQEETL